MSLLEFQNVSYINDDKTILNNISVNMEQGDFISIVGPSGSGKSTFLKLCSHLISPTQGNIVYRGKDFFDYSPTDLRKKITYCFQTPYLFGDTIKENMKFPYTIRNMNFDQIRVDELLNMFHLEIDLNKDVTNLSGGEKQRIALIRSLLFIPDILLLDEVTSALDVENTRIVEKVIESVNKVGTTILWITHNAEQSKKYANKIINIDNGEIQSLEVIK